jgi:hypothetical protein
MNTLLHVSLRQKAVFVPQNALVNDKTELTEATALLVANLSRLGFVMDENLLRAINRTNPAFQTRLLNIVREVVGTHKNWTPLVKGWDVPTGETVLDHIITFFATAFNAKKGTKLACGHIILKDTFPLERYNGCPFCRTPFEFGKIENYGQASKKKRLALWTEEEVNTFFVDLLTSKTALDATQVDSLKILLKDSAIPQDVKIGMKETLMVVIDAYKENDEAQKAQTFFQSPTDILRYLWYKHTGFLQIVEPKTILKRAKSNNTHISYFVKDTSGQAKAQQKAALKLKYNRKDCLTVATWLNNLELDAEKLAEIMHPKRGMWVRFIRALRLAEYSKRTGFERLKTLLDVFYNQTYDVWAGRVNHFRLRADAEKTFKILQQRPGLFARSLFANMLWFGKDETVAAFAEVIDKVPARLVFTLNMYAKNYFSGENRLVRPLGGIAKNIPPNPMLQSHTSKQLAEMQEAIEDLCILAMRKRFAAIPNENKTIFIDKELFNIPVAIGDRSETVQDLPVALMGTRFPVEGNSVRLFMQWGTGLKAQHLDMDLSCQIAYESKLEICSFSNLAPRGCKHSGDIIYIPEKIGTAEYIELDIVELNRAKAKYVTFTCNAYSEGSISPNLVIGWMNSAYPMKISQKSGVAYDPSCVQHQVRVTQGVSKGLVFGVLEVEKRQIVWLEMPFYGQVVQNLDARGVESLLSKLNSKLSVGGLLKIKAEAQGLEIVNSAANADEAYTAEWAINAAAVTQLLVD